MNHSLLVAVASIALPTVASAQLLIAPEGAFVNQFSSSTLTWRSTAFRFQMIYDTTHFTNQGVVGPISIDRMRFRAANGNTAAGGTYLGDGATFGVNISIGTSLTDFAAPSTTLANNRGTMQSVLQNGTVVVAPGAGTSPNDYVIDILIPGGFAYDPTLGQDLLIEVDAPAPSPTTIPSMATGSNQTTNRSVRISNSTQAATTGTISGFASIVLFDISGGPGGIPQIAIGSATAYGAGCYSASGAFAEQSDNTVTTLDLGAGITLVPDVAGAPTRYTVQAGAGAFAPPTGTPLLSNAATPGPITDDTLSQALNLTSFSFPHPGGATSVLHAAANGYLLLTANSGTSSDFSPSLTDLAGTTSGTHAGLPRLCPVWYDFHAGRNTTTNPASGLYFEEDTVNQTATVTWFDIGEFTTSTAGVVSFNFQVVLAADGTVEYRYGAMSPFNSTGSTSLRDKQVSYNPGPSTIVPTSIDISASVPFLTNVPATPLTLSAAPGPVLGGTTTLTTGNVPAPGMVVTIFSFTQLNPGVDLGFIGMGGCDALVDLVNSVAFLLSGSPTAAYVLDVPNTSSLVGAQLFAQSGASYSSMPNPFGAIVSNGVALTIGTLN